MTGVFIPFSMLFTIHLNYSKHNLAHNLQKMEGDNPAISLFNAVERNSLQNQEEEENIEDIRQRQQEVS